jgi:hypothetical protein
MRMPGVGPEAGAAELRARSVSFVAAVSDMLATSREEVTTEVLGISGPVFMPAPLFALI